MGDWDVASEKPAPVDDWSVSSEKASPKNAPVSFMDRMLKPRADTQRPSNIPHAPIVDEAKSLGSGALEGGVYAMPLVGQAIGGFDLGRAGATGIHNLFSDDKQEQPESIAHKIVGSLGLEHTPTTKQGEVLNAVGALLPGAGGIKAVEKLAKTGADKILGAVSNVRDAARFSPPKIVTPDTRAAEKIVANLNDLHKAGGEAPAAVVKMVKEARQAGTPLSLADVSEQNRRLAGVTVRKGGVGREVIKQQLAERDAAAEQRLNKSLNKYLGSGSVRQTIQDLTNARSAAGRPAFEEAMQGGSIAPLEIQYQKEFKAASDKVNELSSAIDKRINEIAKLKEKSTTGYSSEATQQLHAAQFDLNAKQAALKQAATEKNMVLQHLQESSVDRIKGTPGAVWSPQIQRLSQNPVIKSGLNRGMQIERNMADAEGRAFNPTEYAAIKGADGEMEVAKVPNMRVLAVAKEGLDNILSSAELRDPVTRRLTKEGLSIQKLRDSLVSELDRINPKYKEARDIWAGESAKTNALTFGEDAFTEHPEEIADRLGKMSKSEKEFARMGLAEKMREKLLRTKTNGDEAKALINNEWTRKQIRPFFDSEEQFKAFVKDVSAERTMFESGVEIARNSLTADRQAADMAEKLQTGVQASRGAFDLMSGGFRNAAHTAISLWQKANLRNNPELNEAIARLLFDPEADFSNIERIIAQTSKAPHVGQTPKK